MSFQDWQEPDDWVSVEVYEGVVRLTNTSLGKTAVVDLDLGTAEAYIRAIRKAIKDATP
jgi:hypothetical protein